MAAAHGRGRYRWRTRFRRQLPWFLVNRGVARKGRRNCGDHHWYKSSAKEDHCYHCVVGVRRPSGFPDSPNPQGLVELISAAIAAYDPLDPWLVQSNYDAHYWDQEAAKAAPAIRRASGKGDVYRALAEVLSPLIRPPDDDEYVRSRLESAAQAIRRSLRSDPTR
jgi:hypothetical protein